MIDQLEPWLIPWAARLLAHARAPVTVTSVRRFPTRQRRLRAKFLRGDNCCYVAPVGRSAHEFGMAFDVIAPGAELERLGDLWRSWGGLWGGRQDPIHFQGTVRLLQRTREQGHRTK